MDEQKHIQAIESLCRVCGGPVKQNRACKDHQVAIQAVFSIDTTKDCDNIHPKKLCKKCYAVLSRHNKAVAEERVYLHSVQPVEWRVHDAENCSVCESVTNKKKGGRPPKRRKGRGRPSSGDFRSALLDVKHIAPSSFFSEMTSRPPHHIPASLGLNPQDVECPICLEFLDQPLQTSCGTVICLSCIQR